MTNPERCSCGAREKNKCNKESTPIDSVRYGKMCLKELKENQKAKYPYWDAMTVYPEGSVVRFGDKILKCKSCTQSDPNSIDWYDPNIVDKYDRILGEVKYEPNN
jgi:hypothetical protein